MLGHALISSGHSHWGGSRHPQPGMHEEEPPEMQTPLKSSFGNASHPSTLIHPSSSWGQHPGLDPCAQLPLLVQFVQTPHLVASTGAGCCLQGRSIQGEPHGSHLHPAGNSSSQHPANKSVPNHGVTQAVPGQAQTDLLPLCRV